MAAARGAKAKEDEEGPKELAIVLRGKTYRPLDLTVGEVEQIELDLGLSWSQVNILDRVAHRTRVLRAFLARTMDGDAIDALLAGLTLREKIMEVVPATDPEGYEDGLPLDGTPTG